MPGLCITSKTLYVIHQVRNKVCIFDSPLFTVFTGIDSGLKMQDEKVMDHIAGVENKDHIYIQDGSK